ncbi:siderophore-interacting protein [Nocardioides panacihumi]|uniref:Siderophore-interacting protein n=1 Tax=Nocardioides panacihumi TaxID=400774 RepID=A0ABN2QNC9_9ACTN
MATRLTVTATETTTPGLRRVWLRSDDLSAFEGSTFTDRYVKLVFPRPGVELPGYADGTLDMKELRRTLPAEQLPVVRTYTALFPDPSAGTLAIDFVLHGDGEGVAGPWAAAARPGDTLLANGPGGTYAPDPAADWHLLVGDESALPAVMAALAALPEDAVARVVLLTQDADHAPDLTVDLPAGATVPPGAQITVVHRGDGQTLLDAVTALDWPAGRVDAFVHGEAEEVMHGLRPHLLKERGLERDQLSISGYWRRGRTEEGFREWKQTLAAAEVARQAGS